ncbi:MAG TPA: hypothetical protein ENL04_03180 [Sulfuricurvum sp.]|nr:hypothetical protein [Sulfuricurvum sp.]
MKRLLILIATLFLSTTLLQAAAFEKIAKSRSAKVLVSSDKPLHVGSNTLYLDIKVKNTVPEGAKVAVKVFMPAMPGMPAMESRADAESLGNGRYKATVNTAMGGTWQMHIFITPNTGKKIRVKSSVNL